MDSTGHNCRIFVMTLLISNVLSTISINERLNSDSSMPKSGGGCFFFFSKNDMVESLAYGGNRRVTLS